MDRNSDIGHFLIVGSFDGEATHQLVEMVQREWVVVGRGELHGHGIEGWVMRSEDSLLVIVRARGPGRLVWVS